MQMFEMFWNVLKCFEIYFKNKKKIEKKKLIFKSYKF